MRISKVKRGKDLEIKENKLLFHINSVENTS